MRLLRRAVVVAAACVPAISSAAVVATTVAGNADIYLAGQPAGSTLGGDSATTNSPVLVGGLTLVAGSALTFTGAGITDGAGCTSIGPDGCGTFSTGGPANGISAYSGPAQALIGLFLGTANPTSAAAGLDFASTAFTTLAPGLGVVFFIGDGRTGQGVGSMQGFIVPTGAARLYLATSDGIGAAFNNTGAFGGSVDDGIAATPPPARVPEPGTFGLAALGVVGMVFAKRRGHGAR